MAAASDIWIAKYSNIWLDIWIAKYPSRLLAAQKGRYIVVRRDTRTAEKLWDLDEIGDLEPDFA